MYAVATTDMAAHPTISETPLAIERGKTPCTQRGRTSFKTPTLPRANRTTMSIADEYSAMQVAVAAPSIPMPNTPMSTASKPMLTTPAVSDDKNPKPGLPATEQNISNT